MISSLVLHEEAEPVFADKSTVYSRTVGHTLFTVGPAQISLLPYPTILNELFSMLSIMFSKLLCDLSPFTFARCS